MRRFLCSDGDEVVLARQQTSQMPNFRDCMVSPAFVGREREMNALQAGLEDAFAGHGRLLLLVGEPGIGKTRTAYELATAARQRGTRVLLGRCYEGGGGPPFWPWVQIVRSYMCDRDTQTLVAEMGPGAVDIAQVITEMRERLPQFPLPPALEPEQARFRFFDSLTTFLKNAAKSQPLMLILDDLHWADKSSLLLLQFLAREIWETHLLVVGTYRDLELSRQHPLAETLAELARTQGCQRIPLQGLTQEEVSRFIAISTGIPPAAALVAALYQKSEGNPFFLMEIARLLIAGGAQSVIHNPQFAIEIPLPQSVSAVVGGRLNLLSHACHHMLRIASVVGREFSLDVLARVSGTASEQLLAVLEEALAARVIVPVPCAIGRYSFSHALIRETLYEELTVVGRARLHRHIGEMLEELYRVQPETLTLARSGQVLAASSRHVFTELAYHFFAATQDGGDVEKAITYTTQAGEQAIALLAYDEAMTHYKRALHALELTKPVTIARRCQLLLALGNAQNSAGAIPQARRTFQQAADLARELSAPELLAHAALGFGSGVVAGAADEPLVALLEETVGALAAGDSPLRTRVLGRLAMALPSTCQERRVLISQEAVEMARRIGDPAALAYALNMRHWAMWAPENVEDRLAVATEIVRLAEQTANKVIALAGHLWCLTDLLELGDIPAMERELDTYAQLAEELRQPYWLWAVVQVRTMRALMTGEFEEAERLAQQALAIGQRVQDRNAFQYFGVQMFALRREQGRLQELEPVTKHFVERYPSLPGWRCGLAYVYCELGREAETQAEFEYLAANDFATLPRDQNWLMCMTFLAQVCAFLGDTRRAATLYELLLPYARRNVVTGIAAVSSGSVSRSLALLAATLGRYERATQHFEEALAMNVQIRTKPWVAHTQYEYASMLLTNDISSNHEKALKLLHLALNTAQELGMKRLEEKVKFQVQSFKFKVQAQEEARGWRLEASPLSRPQSPVRSLQSPASEDNIFRREGEYWTLAYHGTVSRLKDAKGFHYLALLLRRPNKELHVTELVAAVDKPQGSSSPTPYDTLSEEQLAEYHLSVRGLGDAGSMLDEQAKAAYKRRMAELQEELEEAERFHDSARAAKVRAEIDFLTDELAAAVGLNGQDRKAACAAERARLNVTKAIKAAVNKIGKSHPTLGRHLTASIKTGIFCSYTPDPTQPITWIF